jgi:hypothetical protein
MWSRARRVSRGRAWLARIPASYTAVRALRASSRRAKVATSHRRLRRWSSVGGED